MISGIGTDIVKISRIGKTMSRFGDQFLHRIFSPLEMQEYANYTRDKTQFVASRWAIKEATYKALSEPGIPFNNIQVLSSRKGIRSPLYLDLCGKAKEASDRHNIIASHVSVSHENDFCVAFVVLEKQC